MIGTRAKRRELNPVPLASSRTVRASAAETKLPNRVKELSAAQVWPGVEICADVARLFPGVVCHLVTSTARAKSETRDQTRMTTLTLSFVSAPARSRVETSKPRGARLRHPVRIPKNTRDLSAAITSSGSSSWAGPPHSPSEVYIARVPLVGLEALEWGLGNKYPGELDHTMVLVRHLECETDANGTEKCTDWNAVTCYDFLPRSPRRQPPPPRCSAGERQGQAPDSHAARNTQAQVRVRRPGRRRAEARGRGGLPTGD